MIYPVGIGITNRFSFKNSSNNLAPMPANNDVNENLLELAQDEKTKNTANSLFVASGILMLTSIAWCAIFPKILKKTNSSIKTVSNIGKGEHLKTFESLENDINIPTLNSCQSINKKLKSFLENQVICAQAPHESLIKAGSPQADNRLLMYGKPGSGKSFFAKIFAKTLNANYMEIKYSDINKQYCGEQIENMKILFDDIIKTAQDNPQKKYVVNFNEIDALATPLEYLSSSSSHSVFKKEERATFLIFLEEAAEKSSNLIIIGSSNVAPGNGLDGAVSSRFQNVIEVNYPEKQALFEALKANIEKIPEGKEFILKNSARLEQLAESMYNRSASFRNLNQIVNESKNIYLKQLIKNKNSNYKIEYLEDAMRTMELTDGEISKINIKNKK